MSLRPSKAKAAAEKQLDTSSDAPTEPRNESNAEAAQQRDEEKQRTGARDEGVNDSGDATTSSSDVGICPLAL